MPTELVPTYIVDGLDCQDRESLTAIEQYARNRRECLRALEEQDIDEEELAEEPKELVDVARGALGTLAWDTILFDPLRQGRV